jgi:3-methyladenine DNA glycosylase AlkC
MSLLNAAYDSDSGVRSSIAKSLYDIGKKQPNLVVSSCNELLKTNNKVR